MKKVLVYLPVILSLVILGAHFMRYGNGEAATESPLPPLLPTRV